MIEAICSNDYYTKFEDKKKLEAEIEDRKIREEERKKNALKKRRQNNISLSLDNNFIDSDEEGLNDIKVPEIGFYDSYCIVMYGTLVANGFNLIKNNFKERKYNDINIFLSQKPNLLKEGVHKILFYGILCNMFLWRAQGYLRGLVVEETDILSNSIAEIYLKEKPWGWDVSLSLEAKDMIKKIKNMGV